MAYIGLFFLWLVALLLASFLRNETWRRYSAVVISSLGFTMLVALYLDVMPAVYCSLTLLASWLCARLVDEEAYP